MKKIIVLSMGVVVSALLTQSVWAAKLGNGSNCLMNPGPSAGSSVSCDNCASGCATGTPTNYGTTNYQCSACGVPGAFIVRPPSVTPTLTPSGTSGTGTTTRK